LKHVPTEHWRVNGLSFEYFGSGSETLSQSVREGSHKVRWNWGKFKNTEGFPVNDSLLNQVIGQETALNECFLCLTEWVHKLKNLEKTQWYNSWNNPDADKPSAKTMISPGPYLLLSRKWNKTL